MPEEDIYLALIPRALGMSTADGQWHVIGGHHLPQKLPLRNAVSSHTITPNHLKHSPIIQSSPFNELSGRVDGSTRPKSKAANWRFVGPRYQDDGWLVLRCKHATAAMDGRRAK